MAEYIKREDAIETVDFYYHNTYDAEPRIIEDLRAIEAEDVQPVVHGKWNTERDGMHYCSECDCVAPYESDYYGYVVNAPIYNYCPHCGAKMDKED